MEKTDTILFLSIFCIALVVILCVFLERPKYHSKRKKTGSELNNNGTPKTFGKATAPPPSASRSKEADYAEEHHLWICRYCETMNPIPVSIDGRRSFTYGKPDPLPIVNAGLRGSLVNKEGSNRYLRCVACGKDQ